MVSNRVWPSTPGTLGKRDRLSERLHRLKQDHVVHDLDHLTCTRSATMHDVRAHRQQVPVWMASNTA